MPLSDRLRALDGAIPPLTLERKGDIAFVMSKHAVWMPFADDAEAVVALRDALPLIADIVEAAEKVTAFDTQRESLMNYAGVLREQASALTALREHLEGQ